MIGFGSLITSLVIVLVVYAIGWMRGFKQGEEKQRVIDFKELKALPESYYSVALEPDDDYIEGGVNDPHVWEALEARFYPTQSTLPKQLVYDKDVYYFSVCQVSTIINFVRSKFGWSEKTLSLLKRELTRACVKSSGKQTVAVRLSDRSIDIEWARENESTS